MPNKKTQVQTNSTQGSIKEVPLKAATFQELWDNYPPGDPYDDPAYTDQCAIRMSVALHRVGIEMKSFSSKLVHPLSGQATIGRIILGGKATATRADELGEWLKLQPFGGLPKAEDITGQDWVSKVKGRTGIIQFSRYWTRDGESTANASGGHIDLWNGSRLTISGPVDSIATIGRMFGMNSLFAGYPFGFSDLRNSKQILFWEIK
ncbi:type VI secretion system amidase effector protein Tae4 (plasmid) [Paraburkholderia sprentiae WSM5005]|uniref:Type VI secretion system amidase effector protein Tae4 n=1 Tax=Paraburkholderia sprentiae WSM5005 TaxID=754502 RepID=A0A1I9YUJ0_9BURK|nr:type VI secretion system amidase effector protein Tae4 [Paraburkholderia sprentiae]APA89874.1 type VI secretion system amidase effector protein Tae4 [Paraburkholderia sprentiae WSM5005]